MNGNDPGHKAAISGDGNTPSANETHLSLVLLLDASTCSVADSHVLPTDLDDAKRLLPTPDARYAKPHDSCDAKPAMAAASTATIGLIRYNSVITGKVYWILNSLIILGTNRAIADAVVAIPTANGKTARTLSACANTTSLSAAA